MQGDIWLESEGVGKGCTTSFFVKLGIADRPNLNLRRIAPPVKPNQGLIGPDASMMNGKTWQLLHLATSQAYDKHLWRQTLSNWRRATIQICCWISGGNGVWIRTDLVKFSICCITAVVGMIRRCRL
jgi:hypothetical protein